MYKMTRFTTQIMNTLEIPLGRKIVTEKCCKIKKNKRICIFPTKKRCFYNYTLFCTVN